MIYIDIALAVSKTREVNFIKRRSCLFRATAAVRVQLSSYQFLIRSRFRLLDKIPQILTSEGKVPLILI